MSLLFERVFQVPREDQARALLMFCYAFVMAAAYVVGRAVADSVFLSRVGPDRLPAMYIVSAALISLSTVGYAVLIGRFPLLRVIAMSSLAFAGSCVLLRVMLVGWHHSLAVVAGIYLLAEIRGALGTIQFSTLLNEVFADNNPQRLFGFIGAGATLSGILFGGLVGYEAHQLGTANLLYVVALLDLLLLAPLFYVRRLCRRVSAEEAAVRVVPIDLADANPQRLISDRYSRSIALMVGVYMLVLAIVTIQWKVAAADDFAASANPEDGMTSYFGLFYGAIYLLTGFIQLFVTGRLIHGLGLLSALLLFPSAVLLGTFGVLAASSQRVVLWAVTLTKGSEVLRRSVNDPALQLLYWPLPMMQRRHTIAFVGGIAKPIAEALAGFGVLGLTLVFTNRELSYAVILIVLVWFALAYRCERLYQATVRSAAAEEG